MSLGDIEREQEHQANQSLLQREHNNELRAQLQAAVELLWERTGADPTAMLANRVDRNRLAAAERVRRDRATIL